MRRLDVRGGFVVLRGRGSLGRGAVDIALLRLRLRRRLLAGASPPSGTRRSRCRHDVRRSRAHQRRPDGLNAAQDLFVHAPRERKIGGVRRRSGGVGRAEGAGEADSFVGSH